MLEKILETVDFIKSKTNGFEPEVGIVLGSGLGGLVNVIDTQYAISYKDIPNFPVSTVHGHEGKLILGTLSGRKVIAMQGRFHYYEGYSTKEVTFPIRVLKYLGIRLLVLSNASGGINPDFRVSDIMFITDHINLLPNPLIGKNDDRIGTRFPEMSEAYNKNVLALADKIAHELKIQVQHGVYVGDTGPSYETPAEYNYYRVIGGDCVGMSTVPEVIVARHCGLPVFAVSVITDLGGKDIAVQVTHEEVINAANVAEPKMTAILKEMLKRLDEITF
ncbi:MAG: purine-nucleoside phosphorylase [Bacteroidales bacterium]|jgi:purine-nucleoside phosphorylase|nr:purine-nucleoside phosphorylase [Bacteroidales bacterium]MBO7529817.1 purine-nucleoside phosphorylase [Bacteroidales bacterium]